MPTYEYECPKGHAFEVFQKMTDDPGAKCPECGTAARRKISGGAGFLFKGEGFYITDYRSDDYKKKKSSEAGDSAGTTAKGAGDAASASKDGSASAPKPSKDGGSGTKASKAKSDD